MFLTKNTSLLTYSFGLCDSVTYTHGQHDFVTYSHVYNNNVQIIHKSPTNANSQEYGQIPKRKIISTLATAIALAATTAAAATGAMEMCSARIDRGNPCEYFGIPKAW